MDASSSILSSGFTAFGLNIRVCLGSGKLALTMLQGHSLVGSSCGSNPVTSKVPCASRLVSSCPHLVVMGCVKVPCLFDTGLIVSIMTESHFPQHFEPWGHKRLKMCNWLQLRAANWWSIPHLSYIELNVQLYGKVSQSCGILVVRDPSDNTPSLVPGSWPPCEEST